VTLRTLRIALLTSFLCSTAKANAQDAPYSPSFLATVRRAAEAVPGEPATSVGVLTPDVFTVSMAFMLEGGSSDSVPAGHPAFQLRFPRGWIMVDASIDRDIAKDDKSISESAIGGSRRHCAMRDSPSSRTSTRITLPVSCGHRSSPRCSATRC
jgi:hypothetical protein